MSGPNTLADFERVGDRMKKAIRAAKTSAKTLEPTLGVSSGSFGKLYKGKYPLRQELLEAFAAEVGADPRELVADTHFAVEFGYVEAREPAPEPIAPPAPPPVPAPPAPPSNLDGRHLSMSVPFDQQLTLTDEHEDDLKATEDIGWEREHGPQGPTLDEGLLVDAAEAPPAPAPEAPAPPAEPTVEAAPPQAPEPTEDQGEAGLLSSLTSRFRGLFG